MIRTAGAALVILLAAGPAAALSMKTDVIETSRVSAGYAMAVAPDGVSYVAGMYVVGASPGIRFAAVSRHTAASGVRVWSSSATGLTGGTTLFEESGRGVAIAPGTGTLYEVVAAGLLYTGVATAADAWLARFTVDGTTVWSQVLDGGFFAGAADGFNAVAVAPSGDIYAAGRVEVAAGDIDAWVVRFTPTGVPIGQAVYSAAFMAEEEALAITVDAAGDVYVAGYVTVPGSARNAWVAKLSPDLASSPWSRSVNGAYSSTDYYTGLAVDNATGALYAVGVTTGVTTYTDVLVKRYDAVTGDEAWTRTIDGGEGDLDAAYACSLAPGGDLIVGGALDRPTFTFTDIWLARFAPDGTPRWELTRTTANAYLDEARGVGVDAAGIVRATGFVRGYLTAVPDHPRLWTGIVDESAGPVAVSVAASGAFASPNPWRPGSGGAFDAPVLTIRGFAAGATVRVYTPTGSAVVELPDADRDGSVTWDATDDAESPVGSGVYLWVADGGSAGMARGKVVIVR